MEQVSTWLAGAKRSKAEAARRAGQSRSTLHRIEHGQVDPSIGTLREIAIACGLDITIATSRLSDPLAAFAARSLLDDTFDAEVTPQMAAWIGRFDRAGSHSPVAITTQAGEATDLRYREGAVLLRGPVTALRLASAGHASGAAWALSGLPGLQLHVDSTVVGPSIIWTADLERVGALLADTNPTRATPLTADIIVAPSDPRTYLGEMESNGVRYVAPMQIMLDSIGVGGTLRDQAIAIIQEW